MSRGRTLSSTLASWTTALAIAALVTCSGTARADSLLVINGHIYTGTAGHLFAEAMAVKDGRITAIGSTADVEKQRQSDSRVLDLGGKTVLPGFVDSHVHSMFGSMALYGLNLYSPERTVSPVTQPDEFVAAFRSYAAAHAKDKVLFGRVAFNPQQAPSRALLDKAVPDRPLVIHNTSEHSLWVNSKALELAGITNKPAADADEDKGIFRNPDGSPTGVIREISMEIIERAVLKTLTTEEKLALLRAGMSYLNSFGITTVVNATGSLDEIELFGALRDRNELTVRSRTAFGAVAYPHHLTPKFLKDLETAKTKYHDDWVAANLVKFFADGASGPWPPVYTAQQFKDLIFDLDKRGYQIMTHALQADSATMVLNGYDALEAANGKRDRRLRMEHADRITKEDLPRFAKLSVSASMQPMFCCGPEGDGTMTRDQWNSILTSGANILFSSDWPCTWPPNPLQGIQQAVTREVWSRGEAGNPAPRVDLGGTSTPAERISVEAAVNAYTRNGAYAAFMDQKLGTLETGKFADFSVLSQDIFSTSPQAIATTRIVETVVGGRTVYSAGNAPYVH